MPDKQNKLAKESAADCFQIRSVAKERCVKKIGQVDAPTLDKLRRALALVLTIE